LVEFFVAGKDIEIQKFDPGENMLTKADSVAIVVFVLCGTFSRDFAKSEHSKLIRIRHFSER
jgi:hypothetical protein